MIQPDVRCFEVKISVDQHAAITDCSFDFDFEQLVLKTNIFYLLSSHHLTDDSSIFLSV
jgi:hypothetical protein